MWIYEKKLEYPVNITKKDVRMARYLTAQYGGPDGELAAALRYLNQRYTMPDERGKALLTDIGTEEMAHLEIIAAMIYQLGDEATIKDFEEAAWGGHYTQHDHALFLTDANGVPFTTAYIETTGDFWADLESNMAAEQRARTVYDHLMNQTDDPAVLGPLSFLRQREVIHYTRFKELRDYYLDKYRKNT